MTDKIESTETPAKRFGLVMSWLPAPFVLIATLISSYALVGFIYGGADDDFLFLLLVALLCGVFSLALAAAGYIVSGEFRFFPPLYARRIKQAVLLSPFAMIAGLVILVESTQVEHKAKTESAPVDVTTTQPERVEENWYEETPLGKRKFAMTNRVTDAFVVVENVAEYDLNKGYPFSIAVTVLQGRFIASAYWKMDCEPNTIVADKIACLESGNYAYSTFRVEDPEWDSDRYGRSNINWEFNSSGFAVDEEFWRWPLNEARQKDASQLSLNVARPSPTDIAHVMEYFNKGKELWESKSPE